MDRECTRCRRPFVAADLCRDESKGMEAERKAAGLAGVRFLYYHCPGCDTDDIFVDVLPLEGETTDDYLRRRDALEATVRELHDTTGKAEAVVVTREP
ncbi:MAG TPA: hypothetical protein VM597_15375 [Gemmataceae bacterium]|nr:hypothetical protein [Gemmataceae bacterium]